jgi:MoaA/NifB/PqqE/SkfB family radical SAM enzyme
MPDYLKVKKIKDFPCVPLEGEIDLTYRCNNNCRHCWIRIPAGAEEKTKEFSFEEMRRIVDEARGMGCRKWEISGGEPMLRPDFAEIFKFITDKSVSYSLNTNGTLITPKIARLMKRKGTKMVALYGATARIHDHITRNPGSFEATMRGFAYLKEARAGFIVQIIPMRDNYHQFKGMVDLARSLSKDYRIGATFLFLSACGDRRINREIISQRLSPGEVVKLDNPDLPYEEWVNKEQGETCRHINRDDRLFATCTSDMQKFHIDSYGRMGLCCFIKDPALRCDLRKVDFKESWEKIIPSLMNKIRGEKEYLENCDSCELTKNCFWCPAYGYLEHRRFSAKVDYLCAVAKKNKEFTVNWRKKHRRYHKIADITIQLDSDLPINDKTFHPKFKIFEVDKPATDDIISIRHRFSLPDLTGRPLGKELYRKVPWAIYKKGDSWIHLEIPPLPQDKNPHKMMVFNHDYTRAEIYNVNEKIFRGRNLTSLTLFPTDQVFLAQVLADREGCFFHACGAILEKKGFLFMGHSNAGKSTMARMLKGKAEILCDDRIIIRKYPEGFNIYGSWHHGDVPDISNNSAPLKAILFLEKSKRNLLIPITDKKEKTKKLLLCLIRPFVTRGWWEKTLLLIEKISSEIPCYTLEFDKSE